MEASKNVVFWCPMLFEFLSCNNNILSNHIQLWYFHILYLVLIIFNILIKKIHVDLQSLTTVMPLASASTRYNYSFNYNFLVVELTLFFVFSKFCPASDILIYMHPDQPLVICPFNPAFPITLNPIHGCQGAGAYPWYPSYHCVWEVAYTLYTGH